MPKVHDGYGPTLRRPAHGRNSTIRNYFYPLIVSVVFSSLYSTIAINLIAPQIPYLMKEYFGGGIAASKEAAQVQTILDTLRAAVGFFFVPLYGNMMDTIGRRPFFLLASILGTLPFASLYLAPTNPIWYLACNEIYQLISGAYAYAYLIDSYDEEDRGSIFSVKNGVGILVGLPTAYYQFLSYETKVIVALMLVLTRIPFAYFAVRETLSAAEQKPFAWKDLTLNSLPVMQLVLGNKVMRVMILLVSLMLIAVIGPGEIGAYYLIDKIGFTLSDNYTLGTETAVSGPVALLIGYPFISRFLKPHWIILITFVLLCLNMLGYALVTAPWQVFAILTPLSVGEQVGTPAIISVYSNAGDQMDQGKRLAGLVAIMDLVQTVFPLLTVQFFASLPPREFYRIYVGAAAMLLPAIFICIFWLPKVVEHDMEEAHSRGAARKD